MRALAPIVLALLLAAPHAGSLPAEDGWTFERTPRVAPVLGVGGTDALLVASPFTGPAVLSRDGGATWAAASPFPAVTKGRVAFDPTDALVGYVAGFGGVARTVDGGHSWDLALDVFRAARIDVGPDGRVLVGAREADGSARVLESLDRGGTWHDRGAPLPSLDPICGVAYGRTSAEMLVMTNRRSWYSHDGGATWTETPGAGFEFGIEDTGIVWRADLGLLQRTLDGGASWTDVDVPWSGTAIGAHPEGGVVVATSEGLLRVRPDLSHAMLGGDPVAAGIASVAVHGADAVLLGHERIGIVRVDATGFHSLQVAPFPPASLRAVAVDPFSGAIAAAGPAGAWSSRDDGATWQHLGAGLTIVDKRVALGAAGASIVLGGSGWDGRPEVEMSTDGGRSFLRATLPSPGEGIVMDVAAHPDDPQVAYAAVASALPRHGLYNTRDGGATWEEIVESPLAISGLAWAADGALLVATGAGALSFDGAAWRPLGAPGNVTALDAASGRILAATSEILWQREPAGSALAPWGPAPPARVLRAAIAGDASWLALADGDLVRCAKEGLLATCEAAGPGIAASDVAMQGPRVLAATGAGLATSG